MKRQPTEWDKIFAKDATNKGLISKIQKQVIQLNIQKENHNQNKLARRSKQTFLQRRHIGGQQALEKKMKLYKHRKQPVKWRHTMFLNRKTQYLKAK